MSRLMRAVRGMAARARDMVLRGHADREMDEELRFHVDMETEKYMRRGLDPAEARRRALVAFGGLDRHRERLRAGRRLPLLEPLWHDVRFGLRALARAPGLSMVAIVTIALGVGATTTVFSAVNTLLLRPLPIPGVARLVALQERRGGMVSTGVEGMRIPYVRYEAYRKATGNVFVSLAADRLVDAFSLRLPDVTVAVGGEATSGNYFQTLGVRPVLGRAYGSDDAAEIVISHRLWTTRFGADSSVVGRAVVLNGRTMTIVGVAPAGFHGTTFVADQLWAPVGIRGDDRSSWDSRMVPFGRLRAGVSPAQAAVVVNAVAKRIPPEKGSTIRSVRLDRMQAVPGEIRSGLSSFMAILQGMALLVLLLAAANIAAVMLARGFARRREMALRLAIGAGRARVVRHLLAESLLLFAGGGVLGVGLARLGTLWLASIPLPPQAPEIAFTFNLDGPVLAFALVATGVTGVLFGLVPALHASRPDLVPALKTGGAGSVEGGGRLRSAFVGAQVVLAVTLLLLATLFARSLRAELQTELGFEPTGVVAATITAPEAPDRGRAFQERLLERVQELPGVESVSWSQIVPLSGSRNGGGVRPADDPHAEYTNASNNVVSPGYFATMGVPIVAGRGFTAADDRGGPRVVVINEALAERLWPGRSPLGRRLTGIAGGAVVVGVTTTGRYTFAMEPPTPFVYVSSLQIYHPKMAMEIRAPGAETTTLRALDRIVHDMSPDVAVELPLRMADVVEVSVLPQRFAAQVVGVFGLVGLVLAVLGIYGVLAYQVAQRRREIGVRRALGASSRRVVWSVMRRGAMLAVAGSLLGVPVGAAIARAARAFLFGVGPLDPLTFVAVPAGLLTVVLAASWIPATRAAAVEPSDALRSE